MLPELLLPELLPLPSGDLPFFDGVFFFGVVVFLGVDLAPSVCSSSSMMVEASLTLCKRDGTSTVILWYYLHSVYQRYTFFK